MKARGVAIATTLVSGFCAAVGFHSPAWAGPTPPCGPTGSPLTINMGPINGGSSTYCVSGYGWTDAWFPTTQPTIYNGNLDVLSGDDAPGLSYTLNGHTVPTPGTSNIFNFLSPFLDGGTLTAQNIGTTAILAPFPTGALTNPQSSTVSLAEVQIGITTTVNPDNSVTQTFTFTNESPTATVTGLTFSDYFNAHPDGSNNTTEAACGITSFDPVTGTATTLATTSAGCTPVVPELTMSGALQGQSVTIPNMWDVGDVGQVTCTPNPPNPPTCTTTPGVLADIAAFVAGTGTLNDATGPIGPGDTGAYLVWDLGDLGPDDSTTFTITKNMVALPPPPPLVTTPEPTSLMILAVSLLGFGALRRLRK
jgi:hypothetical protein